MPDATQLNIAHLYAMIGQLTVENQMLKAQLQAMKADKTETETNKK